MPYYVSIKAYTAAFGSSALFNMLRLYGRVGAIQYGGEELRGEPGKCGEGRMKTLPKKT